MKYLYVSLFITLFLNSALCAASITASAYLESNPSELVVGDALTFVVTVTNDSNKRVDNIEFEINAQPHGLQYDENRYELLKIGSGDPHSGINDRLSCTWLEVPTNIYCHLSYLNANETLNSILIPVKLMACADSEIEFYFNVNNSPSSSIATASCGVKLDVYLKGEDIYSGFVKDGHGNISCGNGATLCSSIYSPNSQVILNAETSQDFLEFKRWGYLCEDSFSSSCSFVIGKTNKKIAAFFDEKYLLSVTIPERGRVYSKDNKIVCHADNSQKCSNTYDKRAIVTFYATPDDGWRFAGWGGDCADFGTEACTLTIEHQFHQIAASFFEEERIIPPSDGIEIYTDGCLAEQNECDFGNVEVLSSDDESLDSQTDSGTRTAKSSRIGINQIKKQLEQPHVANQVIVVFDRNVSVSRREQIRAYLQVKLLKLIFSNSELWYVDDLEKALYEYPIEIFEIESVSLNYFNYLNEFSIDSENYNFKTYFMEYPKWPLQQINALDDYDYEEAVCAINDSGIFEEHEALEGRVDARKKDFLDNDDSPLDDEQRPCSSHGTHIASIMVGKPSLDMKVEDIKKRFPGGVNQGAKIMPLKVAKNYNGRCSVTNDNAEDAINYTIDQGVKCSINSWGDIGGYSEDLENAIKQAARFELVFIASAGNNRNNNDEKRYYPSGYRLYNIISVCGTLPDDSLEDNSNIGLRTVDICAPGHSIIGAVKSDSGEYTYDRKIGTSFAVPYVAATVTLLQGKMPDITANEVVRSILINRKQPDCLSDSDADHCIKKINLSGGILDVKKTLEYTNELQKYRKDFIIRNNTKDDVIVNAINILNNGSSSCNYNQYTSDHIPDKEQPDPVDYRCDFQLYYDTQKSNFCDVGKILSSNEECIFRVIFSPLAKKNRESNEFLRVTLENKTYEKKLSGITSIYNFDYASIDSVDSSIANKAERKAQIFHLKAKKLHIPQAQIRIGEDNEYIEVDLCEISSNEELPIVCKSLGLDGILPEKFGLCAVPREASQQKPVLGNVVVTFPTDELINVFLPSVFWEDDQEKTHTYNIYLESKNSDSDLEFSVTDCVEITQ